MILFLLGFLILILFISFNSVVRAEKVSKKKLKIIYFLSVIFVFLISSVIYVYKSNYWLGESLISKMLDNETIKNEKSFDENIARKLIKDLENEVRLNDNNKDSLVILAKTKFLTGDFLGAAESYKKLRIKEPDFFEYLLGEANSRLFLEKDQVSIYTLNLFNKILSQKPNHLLALAVLADDYSKQKKNLLSKKYYLRLLNLLEKDTLEYYNIKQKIEKLEYELSEN